VLEVQGLQSLTLPRIFHDGPQEYAEPSSGYSVDIRIPKTKIVIEVDGPTHYSLGGHDPLGHTQIKRRHLSALGYTLLTVPYWRWYHGEAPTVKAEANPKTLKP